MLEMEPSVVISMNVQTLHTTATNTPFALILRLILNAIANQGQGHTLLNFALWQLTLGSLNDLSTGFFGNGNICNDLDECSDGTNNCDASKICLNTRGSYECVCPKGEI